MSVYCKNLIPDAARAESRFEGPDPYREIVFIKGGECSDLLFGNSVRHLSMADVNGHKGRRALVGWASAVGWMLAEKGKFPLKLKFARLMDDEWRVRCV